MAENSLGKGEGLGQAARDLRYLLDHLSPKGYQKRSLVRLVGDRYLLDKEQRHLLYRSLCSREEAERRRAKLLPPQAMRGKRLAIDGHNVIITIESALNGKPLVLADDGLVRDISGVFARYKESEATHQALSLIFEVLLQYPPQSTLFLFDSPLSKSGELARRVRQELEERGLIGEARAVAGPAGEMLKYAEIIATSDSIAIDKAERVIDLAGYIINEKLHNELITL
ncbi:MAG: DUF434 domain-containing protein [Chloroflexi bacterium]|nr:DUF434 domain-containing protein [Chloroflexota bacterium]